MDLCEMASLEDERLNGYCKNKGDINRNYVLEARFECPICLTCLKDPYLTACGHKFCKDCILQWLKKEGGCCPIDGKTISQEKDLFPDNYTRREIAQQTVQCPFQGCQKVLPLLETDCHILEIHEKVEEETDGLEYHCPYESIGCTGVFKVQSLLVQHTQNFMSQHLQLLSIAHNKLSEKIPNAYKEHKGQEAAFWDPPPKAPSNQIILDPSQALIKSLYERIVILEQKTTEQELQLKNTKEQLTRILDERKRFETNLALRVCNGNYVWNLPDMNNKLTAFHNDPSCTYYSEAFYTSYSGYKFCARIHISPNLKYVSLLIHMVKGENDYSLSWPFSGRIAFTLIHPTLPDLSVCEVMCSRPDLEAFKRPIKTMNTRGFGYSEFILIEHLITKKFFNDDGSVNIKIQITCV